MDRRSFVLAGMSAFVIRALDATSQCGSPVSKGGAPLLPLLSIDKSARLAEGLGIDRSLGTANVFRGLLHSPTAAAGFYHLVNALMFYNKVAARTRELVILRIGWRTGSEYVFCNHVRISRDLGLRDEEILGVRDPERCDAYSYADRSVLRLADELHENAQVTPSTWAALEQTFTAEELVELLLAAGFWRMTAGFLKSTKIPLDGDVPSWPEGKKPKNSAPAQRR